MDDPLLSIQHVTVQYHNTTLFKNLCFKVNKGENWAIIGKSGSGKSAFLGTIAGKLNISGGSITNHFDDQLKDKQIDDTSLFHKRIALVESKHHFRNLSNTTDFYYQQRYNSSGSEDALTVTEYLQQIAITQNQSKHWTLEKVIKILNLEELCKKQLIKLSNGETKRLLLAAALLKNPVILLLDTPLTGLDILTRVAFNDILNEIIASGITVIMTISPHELPDAITHVAIMEYGGILQTFKKSDFKIKIFDELKVSNIDKQQIYNLLKVNYTKPVYDVIVKMNRVNIKYEDQVILKDVKWQISPGERWALLGPNGAGKSTLLSLINGDNPQAYANDIILFDRKRGTGESIWDIKSKIGFVSPELHQYFPMDNNCLQVIESGYYDTLGLFRHSQKNKAETALNWMKALKIDKYAGNLLKNIPASAQHLCLLARALIKNPDLLIFDEPCQGLDEDQQQHFKQLIDTLCEMSNVTLIYVTHYQHEIPDSVTKFLRLNEGMVV